MLFCAWILAWFLHVNEAQAMVFTPTTTDIAVEVGTVATQDFSVQNDTLQSLTYIATLYDVTLSPDGSSPQFSAISSEHAAILSLNTSKFTLAPNAARVVLLTVSAPMQSQPDSFAVGLVVREVAGDNAVTVATGVSSLVFVTIGDPAVAATLNMFSAAPVFTSHLATEFVVTIENGGERTLQPYGFIDVKNTWGKSIAQIDMNPALHRVPSRHRRLFTSLLGDVTQQNFFHELWREITEHRFGIFTATLVAAPYPGVAPTLSGTTRMVVVPWRSMSFCLLIIAGIVAMRKRRAS